VTAIRGIIFHNDGKSSIVRMLVRPLEALDRWIVGILPKPEGRCRTLPTENGFHLTRFATRSPTPQSARAL
jgi:hypothetical protein